MVYIFGTLTLSILFTSLFKPGSVMNNNIHARLLASIALAIVQWRITFRDITGDTSYYVNRFKSLYGVSLNHSFELYNDDRMFLFVLWICSRITQSAEVFLFIIGLIFLLIFSKFLNKVFTPWQSLFVLFSYSLYPFFNSYATNTIRQGLAIVLILVALAYYINGEKNWLKTIVLLTSACLFHWSAVPFAVLVLLIKKINFSLKFTVMGWSVTATLYLTGLQSTVMSSLTPYIPKFTMYENVQGGAVNLTGNRIDFFLFSCFFVALGLLLCNFYCRDERYQKLLKIYVLFNAVFMMMGFMAYSDRIAAYSWFLIPILIWSPIFLRKKYFKSHSLVILLTFTVIGLATGMYF